MSEFITGVTDKFPKELLKGRIEIEGNLISCLFQDMLLLDETKFVPKDFITSDGSFYFSLLNNLRKKGFYSLDEVTILSNLSNEVIERYEDLGGWDTIQHQIDIINTQNFDTYADILYRENILLNMYRDGFNLLNEIDVNGKMIKPLKLFRRMTAEEVTDWYEARLTSYGEGFSTKVIEEEEIDFDDQFIEDCVEGLENGVPFEDAGEDINLDTINCFPFLSRQINGLLPGTTTMLGGFSSAGKALTLDSDLLTPSGYIKMKDVKVGDYVYSDDGKSYMVNGVFPQGKKDIYRVTFSDNTYVDCSDDHLWNVITMSDYSKKNNNYRTVPLSDIINGKLPYKYNTKSGVKYNLRIPMCQPVEFLKHSLPINPYALGLLIGDGCLKRDSLSFTNPEDDVVDMLRDKLGNRYGVLSSSNTRDYQYRIVDYNKDERPRDDKGKYIYSNTIHGLKKELYDLGLLDLSSYDKFIPNSYKFSSIEDRLDILAGLIDTDGTIDGNLYDLSSTSERLIKDVKFIVESLGGTCRYVSRTTKYTKKDGSKSNEFLSFRCYFKLPDNLHAFKSKKHIQQFSPKERGRNPIRTIKNIEYIKTDLCQCISINSPSHLYLTNNCIVTHNTTWWTTTLMGLLEQNRKILIISNEENVKKFKIKFLVWLLTKYERYYKLTKKKLMSGNISSEDREHLKNVQEYWKEKYKGKVKFISINDADMSVVKKKIRENVLRYGYDTVLYDTFKIQATDIKGERTDLSLVRDSRDLDKLAKKYDLIMLCSVQLAEAMRGTLFLSASVLSNSKQIKEQLENLLLMRTLYDVELDEKSKYFCHPFRLKKINDKWIEEKYDADSTGIYRILFVEKCRSGSNSSDTGVAYLLKYDGDHCVFREVAQCRPKHGMITG